MSSVPAAKDISELYLLDPANFVANLERARARGVPFTALQADRRDRDRAESAAGCAELAAQPRILDVFYETLGEIGHVGEAVTAAILYLAVVSRLLAKPVSVVVKGPSAAGKSYTVETTLAFFTPAAYHALSAMSERAVIYGRESLAHRMFVLYEGAGLNSDFTEYLLRSLLSEGHIRYEVTERAQGGGFETHLVERKGPTGLIITTTAIALHSENETRMLSLPITDTPEQTRAVMRAIARGRSAEVDLSDWHALDTWLSLGPNEADVPYAELLAELIPPIAVRLRRDFGQLLNLIRAHALLHQATRETDDEGNVVATLDDYAVVRQLVHELFSDEVEATVPRIVRETVEAIPDSLNGVSGRELAELLGVHPGTVSRRVEQAIALGYIVNDEWRAGHPARYRRGNPLPDELVLLPTVETLQRCIAEGADPIPPPEAHIDSSEQIPSAPTIEWGTQLALGEDPSSSGAVARVLQLYPELHDWPLDKLAKIAPSILEQHAERERADK
jgi:hypothetical protein